MFCKKCGAPLEAGAKFCSSCGSLAGDAQMDQQNQNYGGNQNTSFPGGMDNSGSAAGSSYNNAGDTLNSSNNAGYNDGTGSNTSNTGYNPNQGNGQYNNGYSTGYYGDNNNGAGNFQQQSPMPKSKKPVFVGILAAVLVIALLAGGYFTFGKNLFLSPVKKTLTSMTNVAKAKAVDSETTIKLKLSGNAKENALVKSIAENMAIKINSKSNKEKTQGDFKVSLVMNKQSIMDLSIYADQDIVVISSEGLLDKPLYFNTKDINKLSGTENASKDTPDFKKYESILKDLGKDENYKAMSKDYSKFFEDVLKDFTQKSGSASVSVVENGKERSIKCSETTVTIDENFVKKVVKGLMEKVSTDNNLKALIKAKANEFYKLAEKNGDLEKFDLDADTFKKDMDNFDSEWDKAMKELKTNMNDVDSQLADLKLNSTAKFKIDSSNRLRQLTYEIDGGETIGAAMNMEGLSGSVIIETTFNAFDGDVKITKPSTNGAQNLAEMDQYEMMNLMSQVEEKLQQILGSSFGGMQ